MLKSLIRKLKPNKKMFRRIISNLPFSPSLVGQLSMFGKRMRKEVFARKISVILVTLTLIVQFLIVFQPPESANSLKQASTPVANVTCYYYDSVIDCPKDVSISLSAINSSQGFINANGLMADTKEQISFGLSAKNSSSSVVPISFSINVADILEYANIFDFGNGSFEDYSKTISWPRFNLEPGTTQTRSFLSRVVDVIPATARGKFNPYSYDCVISGSFGNSVNIPLNCPTPKFFEKILLQLPSIDKSLNIAFALTLFIVSTFFLLRARLIEKEIQIIRKNINSGSL